MIEAQAGGRPDENSKFLVSLWEQLVPLVLGRWSLPGHHGYRSLVMHTRIEYA